MRPLGKASKMFDVTAAKVRRPIKQWRREEAGQVVVVGRFIHRGVRVSLAGDRCVDVLDVWAAQPPICASVAGRTSYRAGLYPYMSI